MNLAAQDTAHHLKAHPLPAISLIYGSEALLNAEALDALRARATADGFSERQRLYGDTRIDTLIAELETPSLFAPRRLLELYRTPPRGTKRCSVKATSPSPARRSTPNNSPNKSAPA